MDVLSRKPALVFVMLGMNDGEYRAFDKGVFNTYARNMRTIMDRLNAAGATVIPMAPTPLDYRGVLANPRQTAAGRAKLLDYPSMLVFFGTWLREEAMMRGWNYVDLNTPFYRAHLTRRRSDPAFTLIPDAIHPEVAGQVLMAMTVVHEAFVPELAPLWEVRARPGKGTWQARAAGGRISVVRGSAAKLSFKLAPAALPWALPPSDAARRGWALSAIGSQLNRQLLQVEGLRPGRYRVAVNGKQVGTWADTEFGRGIDLGALTNTPQYRQALKVAELNATRNADAIHPMRALFEKVARSQTPDAAAVEQLWQQAREHEDAIYQANRPQPLTITISP
jgi:hypothetical protein